MTLLALIVWKQMRFAVRGKNDIIFSGSMQLMVIAVRTPHCISFAFYFFDFGWFIFRFDWNALSICAAHVAVVVDVGTDLWHISSACADTWTTWFLHHVHGFAARAINEKNSKIVYENWDSIHIFHVSSRKSQFGQMLRAQNIGSRNLNWYCARMATAVRAHRSMVNTRRPYITLTRWICFARVASRQRRCRSPFVICEWN